jgi:hypothetical protein
MLTDKQCYVKYVPLFDKLKPHDGCKKLPGFVIALAL